MFSIPDPDGGKPRGRSQYFLLYSQGDTQGVKHDLCRKEGAFAKTAVMANGDGTRAAEGWMARPLTGSQARQREVKNGMRSDQKCGRARGAGRRGRGDGGLLWRWYYDRD